MGAQLKSTVFVKDPDTRRTVRLEPGTLPEPRYAALVTNPEAWVDGKLPRLPKAKTDDAGEGGSPSGDGQDADPGAPSASADADPKPEPDPEPAQGDGTDDDKPAARKTTARKTAARKPAAD